MGKKVVVEGNGAIDSIPDATVAGSIITAYILDRLMPIAEIIPRPLQLLGWVIIAIGVLFALYAISVIRLKNRTSNVTATPPALIAQGLYAYSRNPFYAAYVAITIGVAVVLGSVSAFAGPIICITVLTFIIRFEEKKLNAAFGHTYEQYRRSVRRWI